jgi:hypothetical protein
VSPVLPEVRVHFGDHHRSFSNSGGDPLDRAGAAELGPEPAFDIASAVADYVAWRADNPR